MLGNIWTSYVKKGFYPYEWVDGNEKLNFECIPPLEVVHSQLKKRASYMMTMMMKTIMKKRKQNHHQREQRALP